MEGYLTIRKAAQTGIMPENMLRTWLKEKKLPGVYAGTRFYVNMEALREQLETESRTKTLQVIQRP